MNKHRLFFISCFLLAGLTAKSQLGIRSIKPYTQVRLKFEPKALAAQGNSIVMAGKTWLVENEDTAVGGAGERNRFYPQLVCVDTTLAQQWELAVKDKGYRAEFTHVEYINGLGWLVILHASEKKLGGITTHALIIDDKGRIQREKKLGTTPYGCMVKRVAPGEILLGYAIKAKDSIKLCVQVLNDSLQRIRANTALIGIAGNGKTVNDAAAFKNGYIIGTELGLKAQSEASVFITDKNLNITRKAFFFAQQNSETDKILADGENIYAGVNTYNRAKEKGLALIKTDALLDTLFIKEFGECIHDDVVDMAMHNNAIYVAHEAGLIQGAREDMIDRSGITVFSKEGKITNAVIFGNQQKPEKAVGMAKTGNRFLLLSRTNELLESRAANGEYKSFMFYSYILRLVNTSLTVVRQAEFGNF